MHLSASPRRPRRREDDVLHRWAELLDAPPFPVWGLDRRWSGSRFLCGHGSANGLVHEITLCHGDPADEGRPMVRISTRRPRPIGPAAVGDSIEFERDEAAADLVRALFHRTGELRDDVRAAAFARGAADPTAPWDAGTTTVDGVAVALRTIGAGDTWVGMVALAGQLIAIEATGWSVDATGLVSMTDLSPYRGGTDELRRRFS